MLFKRPTATRTKDSLDLLVWHFGRVYLRPEGSNINSMDRWISQHGAGFHHGPDFVPVGQISQFFTTAYFFYVMDPYQQTNEKVGADLIK